MSPDMGRRKLKSISLSSWARDFNARVPKNLSPTIAKPFARKKLTSE